MSRPPRVLVTRAAQQVGRLSEGLRARGIEPVEVPVLEIRPPESYAALDAALGALTNYDWLVVASANAVDAVAARAVKLRVPLAAFERLQIAAIGPATEQAVRKAGLDVALMPEKYVAESLAAELAGRVRSKRVLIVRAAVARDVIPNSLRATGAEVTVAEAYRNAMPEAAPEQLRCALDRGIVAATFTSSSSVRHLADAAQAAGIAFPFAGVKAISIGPITSATLSAAGWEPAAEADPSDISGLVEAVAEALLQG